MQKVKSAKVINNYIPAPLWKRFLAYVMDLFIVNLIVTLPFQGYLSKFSTNPYLLFTSNDKGLTYITFFIAIALIVYFSVLEYKIRQSLGKIIMNIYVVSLDSKQLTFGQAVMRNLTKPFPIVLLVDVVYMFFKRGHQRLFEVFSRTAVVEKEMIIK